MASPTAQPNGHPSTPPASDSAANNNNSTQPQQQAPRPAEPEAPLTSVQDDGLSTRPKDARLLHLVLSSLGVQSYQERVPLQLMDFAYRYTSSVLSDSLRLSAEGYSASTQNERDKRRGAGGGNAEEGEKITVTALRQAIASRQGYTFQGALPKEFMMAEAAERNRLALPKAERGFGAQLPDEKYCLTGVGWGLKDEWSSDEEVEEAETNAGAGMQRGESRQGKDDANMGGMDRAVDGEDDDEGGGRMEDVFGEEGAGDASMGDA